MVSETVEMLTHSLESQCLGDHGGRCAHHDQCLGSSATFPSMMSRMRVPPSPDPEHLLCMSSSTWDEIRAPKLVLATQGKAGEWRARRVVQHAAIDGATPPSSLMLGLVAYGRRQTADSLLEHVQRHQHGNFRPQHLDSPSHLPFEALVPCVHLYVFCLLRIKTT